MAAQFNASSQEYSMAYAIVADIAGVPAGGRLSGSEDVSAPKVEAFLTRMQVGGALNTLEQSGVTNMLQNTNGQTSAAMLETLTGGLQNIDPQWHDGIAYTTSTARSRIGTLRQEISADNNNTAPQQSQNSHLEQAANILRGHNISTTPSTKPELASAESIAQSLQGALQLKEAGTKILPPIAATQPKENSIS